MLTFFSSPKSWQGNTACQQENAIINWFSLHPGNEVILYGDAPGTREACARTGAVHVPRVSATVQGIPYFGAMAEHAAAHGRNDLQVYLNADILLCRNFLAVVRSLRWRRFLMIGQRLDLSESESQQTGMINDHEWLRTIVRDGRAALHPPDGSDYFVFPRGLWQDVPPIVIGRGAYDNVLISWCLLHRIPVVDATPDTLALHQFHDYGHVPGGRQEIFGGSDAELNLGLCRHLGLIATIEDATWVCHSGRLSRNFGRGDLIRGLLDRILPWIPTGFARQTAVRLWARTRRQHAKTSLPH